ncbi:MAG TPA: hypothetical protein VGI72_06800 [Gaiellales bacterium]
MTGDPRQTVAIIPAEAKARHAPLLAAFEEAYPVRFADADGGDAHKASGVVVFPGGSRPQRLAAPCLVLQGPRAEDERNTSFTVTFPRADELHRALHGQRLVEHGRRPPPAVAIPAGGRALALAGGRPIWTQSDPRDGDCQVVSAVPDALGEHEFLRDHLTAGRFWSLLPVVQFVRRIALGDSERSSPLRACFVIDDPNVRFSSYGHVHFRELARDARECGYHVAVATIPLDLLLPGCRAVGVFREHPSELSLVVHGNDHVHRELERRRSAAAAERMIMSAAARVARFEPRTGIRIDRLMCPPHGGCSEQTLEALFRCGFLGLAASRPFPWEGFSDHLRWRLGGWLPAQMGGGGLPVLPRYPLGRSLDDLVFRAFLDQPLIVYCHHDDLRHGLAPLRAAAARAAELGDVRWMSLASIARASAACRDEGAVATVTPYSRDLRIRRPAAPTIEIEIPRTFGAGDALRVVVDGMPHDVRLRPDGGGTVVVANPATTDGLRIRIDARGDVAPATLRDWRPRAWPVARRAMTEARDRTLPLLHTLRR